MKRFLTFLLVLTIATTNLLVIPAGANCPSYKITVEYDDALCDVTLTDWYTKLPVENGGYITEDATANRAYLQFKITNIPEGYRIGSVTRDGRDASEGFISGAYGGCAITIRNDTVFVINIEQIPETLPKIISGEIYYDGNYTEKVEGSVTFTDNSRIYTKVKFDSDIPSYLSGCYYEYSTDKINWTPYIAWGNRVDFWAGWSSAQFDFVNTKNYYIRAHLFGRNYYSTGDCYTDIILVNPTDNEEVIDVGNYIQIGTYYGEPIIWRCVYTDENGPMLISDKQLSMKCYSGGTNQKDPDGDSSWGNSRWAVSDIRSWLNSTKPAGAVEWLDSTAPDENASFRGYNAYDKEAGFLSEDNFSPIEVKLIKPVSRKSYLSAQDADKATSGAIYNTYEYVSHISELSIDFDALYAEQVTDKMFIPNLEDILKIWKNADVLGDGYIYALPTEVAKTKTECSYGDDWDIWVSHPANLYGDDENSRIYTLCSNGRLGWRATCGSDLTGIRPAFYLSDDIEIKSGDGTFDSPYILEYTAPYTETVLNSKNNKSEFAITVHNAEIGCAVFLALYDGDKLVEAKYDTFKGEDVLFTTDKSCTDAKVMVWENKEGLVPVCEVETVLTDKK